VFSSRCGNKTVARKVGWQGRKIGLAAQSTMSAGMDMATGTKRAVRGPRYIMVGRSGECEDERADVPEEEDMGTANDIVMAKTVTTTPIKTEADIGVLPTKK